MTPDPDAARVVGAPVVEDAVAQAVTAFARALRLSCLAAGNPARAALANDAVAAHVVARAWAEEAVRRAGRAGRRSTRL